VLGAAQRNATVRCIEAMDVLVLPRREFAMLSGRVPELQHLREHGPDAEPRRVAPPAPLRADLGPLDEGKAASGVSLLARRGHSPSDT